MNKIILCSTGGKLCNNPMGAQHVHATHSMQKLAMGHAIKHAMQHAIKHAMQHAIKHVMQHAKKHAIAMQHAIKHVIPGTVCNKACHTWYSMQ